MQRDTFDIDTHQICIPEHLDGRECDITHERHHLSHQLSLIKAPFPIPISSISPSPILVPIRLRLIPPFPTCNHKVTHISAQIPHHLPNNLPRRNPLHPFHGRHILRAPIGQYLQQGLYEIKQATRFDASVQSHEDAGYEVSDRPAGFGE